MKHISEYTGIEVECLSDLINNNCGYYWDLYLHIEKLYELFFISFLDESGVNLLMNLEKEKLHGGIDILELREALTHLSFKEVASLEFFEVETLFLVYYMQVHT